MFPGQIRPVESPKRQPVVKAAVDGVMWKPSQDKKPLQEPCCECDLGFRSLLSALTQHAGGSASLPTREELEASQRDQAARVRKAKLDAKNGTTPSPLKRASMQYTQSPVRLEKTADMYDRDESANLSVEEARVVKELSMTEPGVLVGYQIEARETSKGEMKTCVVVGIQSTRGFATEFLISQLVSYKNRPLPVPVDTWERLNRKPTSSSGLDFRVLRRVLAIPKDKAL